MKTSILLCAVYIAVAAHSVADAQLFSRTSSRNGIVIQRVPSWTFVPNSCWGSRGYYGYGTYPWGYYGTYPWGHYGTYPWGVNWGYSPVQGSFYGAADLARAQGDRARAISEARLRYDESQKKEIENRLARVKAHLAAKELGQERRSALNAARRETLQRYLAAQRANRAAKSDDEVVSSKTGRIKWPLILYDDPFSKPRQQLDQLFQNRADTGGAPDDSAKIKAAIHAMMAALRAQIRKIPTNDYLVAYKFLDALRRTAQSPQL